MVHLARWQRVTGWCGVGFFILMAAAFFGFEPDLGESLSAAEFVDRASEGDALRWFSALGIPAMILWLWFAAGVRERLAWGWGWTPLRALGWAAAVGATSLLVAVMAMQSSLVNWRDDFDIDDELTRATFHAGEGIATGAIVLLGLWLFASGLAAAFWNGMPKWWGWPAVVAGAVTMIAAALNHDLAFAGFAFWWLWSLVGALWLAFAKAPALHPHSAGDVALRQESPGR